MDKSQITMHKHQKQIHFGNTMDDSEKRLFD